MEINEYRPKQAKYHNAASEYEESQIKSQQIKQTGQEQKPVQISKNGQSVIKGEIIDIRYQEVKIRMEPRGQVITARLSGDLPLSIGQTAEFVVADETDGLITLRYIPSGNTPVNDIIHKALSASGLSASERNMTIVESLLNYQMPVDKKTILQFIKLTAAYPDVNVSTLVLMHKNKLQINIGNIAQFEAYQRGNHQLLSQLKSLIDYMSFFPSDMIKDTEDIMKGSRNTGLSLNDSLSSKVDSITQGNHQTDNINTDSITSGFTKLSSINSGNINSLHDIDLYGELLALLIDKDSKPEYLSPDSTLGHILPAKDLMNLSDTILKDLSKVSYYSNEQLTDIQIQLSDGSMPLEGLLNIIYDLYGDKSLPLISDNNMALLHVFEAFISSSSQLSSGDSKKLIHLLKSDSYRDIITEALHQRWTLGPRDLTEENKVKEFYKRLDKDMAHLDKLTESFRMSSEVKTSINKLQDNLQFMKDLNNLFLYLQLPIRFKEQDVHGDLYVFTRKNQKHYDTERLNVLLHLDMTHLGSVDIHLFMSNRQVKAIFYLEKSSEQLIAKNMHELIDVLNDKGYQLEASTQVSDSKPDFINDILQNDAPSSNTHRYSFDIRA
jgi:hypothetical protein